MSTTTGLTRSTTSSTESTLKNAQPAPSIYLPSNSLSQRVLLWFLQVFGAISVVIFGTFSILSWKDAEHGKAQADIANLISFISLCDDVANSNSANKTALALATICTSHTTAAIKALDSFAKDTFPLRTTPAGLPTGLVGQPSGISYGVITGIAIGSAAVVVIITSLTLVSFQMRRAARNPRHRAKCTCTACSEWTREKQAEALVLTRLYSPV